jgi:hypothetical protein
MWLTLLVMVKKLVFTALMLCFLAVGMPGVLSIAWSDSASDARNPDTGAVTPVKTLEQAQKKTEEEKPSQTKPETTAPTKPLSVFTEGSLTHETVDANGNTVSTSESYRDKVLRRRLTYVLNPSSQVLERMSEVFSKTGEIQSIQQTRFDEKGEKIFDGQYQFTDDNISKAQLTEWHPQKIETFLDFDKQGFPLQQTVTYADGSVKNFDASRSETTAQKLLEQQFPNFDPATLHQRPSRFLKAEDLGDGTLYPGGFIGLHFVTYQVGENGPTLSYIGGVDPVTGGPVVLATRTTTDYWADFYGGE